jgi:hypothetical protein
MTKKNNEGSRKSIQHEIWQALQMHASEREHFPEYGISPSCGVFT